MDRSNGKRADAPAKKSFNGLKWNDGRGYRPGHDAQQGQGARASAFCLMSRAKVPTNHAKGALGHVMGGVRETFNRHEYLDEKRAAFEVLATLVSRSLNFTANIVELAPRRAVMS